MTTKFFYDLTPERVLAAVESAGFQCTGRALALNSMENRVYEVEIELDDAPSPSERFRVVKFYRPGRWTREQILEEHEFLLELAAEDLPVVPPIALSSGSTLQTIPDTELIFSVFPKRGGRTLDELTPELALRVGRLLARMHIIGGRKKAEHRVALTPDSYGVTNLKYLLSAEVVPQEQRARYEDLVSEIVARSRELFNGYAVQRVHGDVHFGNVLLGRDGVCLVDFDDMVTAPPVQDLWLLFPGEDADGRQLRELLLEGYEEFRPFDRSSLRLVEPLRALRLIHFAAWIARRWSDPAFPRVFPYFGTGDYWRTHIVDLEEQREKIAEL